MEQRAEGDGQGASGIRVQRKEHSLLRQLNSKNDWQEEKVTSC